MSFLDFAPDPKQHRALKLFLIGTLVVGAFAGAVARPLPAPVASWLVAPAWTLSYLLMAMAAWLAWTRGAGRLAMAFYTTQLALDLAWRFRPTLFLGAAMNLAMLVTLILFAGRNWRAALTFLPCMVWSLSVSVPMSGFWWLN